MDHLLIDRPLDGVARLTLNRPETLNSLSRELVKDFSNALDDLAEDPTCRVVIVTGAGRGFCSGQDMRAAAHRQTPGVSSTVEKMGWQSRFAGMAQRMQRMPQPVICAVNGVAAGAGMAIAVGADIRIGTPATRFLVASVRIGLSAGESGISYFLPRWIGAARAFEIMLTGRPIEAEEALATGLILRCVAPEALAEAALDQARAILANSPFAVAQTKRIMWRNLDAASLDHALDLENPTQIVANTTADYREALTAFGEKRPPRFTGD
ncbi:MAG TPA: enoyl-CoA hydratase-related protein [Novosphingobium sp.]